LLKLPSDFTNAFTHPNQPFKPDNEAFCYLDVGKSGSFMRDLPERKCVKMRAVAG
jgi:hypothetical protein